MEAVNVGAPPIRKDLLSTVGSTLRAIRTARRLTLREVAEGAHISVSYLAEIERGEKDPSSRVLESIARGLGIGVGELLRHIADELEPPAAAESMAA
ncbi:XRE family transcriptional regulator [Rubrobacter taiwanensis]|jgi:transcriptional regulator with XRE-family HTH domain|uniref:XRE family transcriptional regulator n=1 Tax=Rubrobacter taiwanensis TaxID=185139 RepID=A0A4R1BJI4_9ACTN|nr:helix-turn-helix transcriptional regulator [Rubrobacter taiwanensis]TCJ17348.1 XRE family transcriptional regulator [Rubrobacter taiwanensis]